jgi:hypothetical protein
VASGNAATARASAAAMSVKPKSRAGLELSPVPSGSIVTTLYPFSVANSAKL